MQTVEMDRVRSNGPEAQPIKSLDELYDKLDSLTPWPEVVELRESTEYVYRGSDVNIHGLKLERIAREDQPRTIVCHDMKGGYLEDRFIDGSSSYDSYTFYHWSIVDTFIYFSHYFVTIPPYGWINAAHNHGVKVLGTVITEGSTDIWDRILESKETVRKFANALVTVTKFYKFEGWLLNVENKIKPENIDNLLYFVRYLTENIHGEIDGSEIIWYDSVTIAGELKWQNELNDNNKEFFLCCDGIFLNYNWTESRLASSYINATNFRRNVKDIYVGLDVWGRGCPGGGGFNSARALEMIRAQGLSVAIFAPGWTHEYFGPTTFYELENMFWAQLYPYLYVHVPIYENEVFRTSFCKGSGTTYYRSGEIQFDMQVREGRGIFEQRSFYNLTMQKPQLSIAMSHLKFTYKSEKKIPKNENEANSKDIIEYIYETIKGIIRICENVVNFEKKLPAPDVNYVEFYDSLSYEGGSCLKLVTKDTSLYHRLLLVHIDFSQEIQATVVYYPQEISTNPFDPPNKPSLILGNYTTLNIIPPLETYKLPFGWTKCVYFTNMRVVNEIGICFTMPNECYLGEIVVEQKQRQFDHYLQGVPFSKAMDHADDSIGLAAGRSYGSR